MKTMTRILGLLAIGAAASCADTARQAPTTSTREAADKPPAANQYGVVPSMELVITDPNVVDSTTYATEPCSPTATPDTAWSFQHLVTAIAGQNGITGAANVAYMVEDMLDQWMADQTVTVPGGGAPAGEVVPNRATMMQQDILGPWPTLPNGSLPPYLDLSQAPLRLLAIVNRMDLRTSDGPSQAGQGRFVFGAVYRNTPGTCVNLPFTVIFEYNLSTSVQSTQAWAEQWHALGTTYQSAGFTPGYLAALHDLTKLFTQGSGLSLSAIRTDEVALAPVQGVAEPNGVATVGSWDLREIHPQQGSCPTSVSGSVPPACLLFAQTTNNPDYALLSSQDTLYNLIDGYQCTSSSVSPIAGYQGAYAPNFPTLWNASSNGVAVSASQRHAFALNTSCAGCHSLETGNQAFMHILPRNAGSPSQLSNFLTGCSGTTLATADCEGQTFTAYDPVSTQPANGLPLTYAFNEIDRRSANLINLVNGETSYANCL
jgi:hypothetical protein